jgi:hypothetical protein
VLYPEAVIGWDCEMDELGMASEMQVSPMDRPGPACLVPWTVHWSSINLGSQSLTGWWHRRCLVRTFH